MEVWVSGFGGLGCRCQVLSDKVLGYGTVRRLSLNPIALVESFCFFLQGRGFRLRSKEPKGLGYFRTLPFALLARTLLRESCKS